jgi:hypothetical protein
LLGQYLWVRVSAQELLLAVVQVQAQVQAWELA